MFDDDFCDLNEDNYARYFHCLLYLDEFEAVHKLERYNMSGVPLKIVNSMRLQLEVSCSTFCIVISIIFVMLGTDNHFAVWWFTVHSIAQTAEKGHHVCVYLSYCLLLHYTNCN
jgi:hypothetical protein